MATGSCLCGAVRYEVSGPYPFMANCHCSMCRKHHGSLFNTTLGVAPANFRWLTPEDRIGYYQSSPAIARTYCKECGSKLPEVMKDIVIVPAGGLDEDIGMQPSAHIFVASKSPLSDLDDQLPKFDGYPPGYGEAVACPAPPAAKAGVTQGSCLCGDVVYEVDFAPTKLVNCHCSRCRKSRGAEYATNFFARPDQLRWVRGGDKVKHYKLPDAQVFSTAFCKGCGSLMPAMFEAMKMYNVPVGALDTPVDAKPHMHIYTTSKAPWNGITDNALQFDEMPPRERFRELFL
jgi:hypothetical protein